MGLQNRESGKGGLRGEIKWMNGEMGRRLRRREMRVFGYSWKVEWADRWGERVEMGKTRREELTFL